MGSIRWIPWDCHGRSTKLMELFADPLSHCVMGYTSEEQRYVFNEKFIFKSSCVCSFLCLLLLLLSTSSKYSRARALISIFTQYVYLNGSDEDGGVVRGKRGTEYGLVVKKCKTCFVIGIHGNNLETRHCSAHVEGFGEYLIGQGM